MVLFDKFIHLVFDQFLTFIVKSIGLVMLFCILLQVGSRVFLKIPFPWTDELARFSFIWFCFLGSVLTMRHKMHLGIDYFERKMNARGIYINGIFVWFCVISFGLIIACYGYQLLDIVAIQKTPIMRVSMVYPYAVLPISGFFITVLSVYYLCKHLTNKD